MSTTAIPPSSVEPAPMSHRAILEALSGLLLAMFVAMLSSTIVSTALPVIVSDLHGTESGYTWVMVAMLLALTATTPIWGSSPTCSTRSCWCRGPWSSLWSARSWPGSRRACRC